MRTALVALVATAALLATLAPPARADSARDVRTAVVAAAAYAGDHGGSYAGMTVTALRRWVNVKNVKVVRATRRSYCLQSISGRRVHFDGPSGPLRYGACGVPTDPPENGFRAPASAAKLTEKTNTWRTVAALPAPQPQQRSERQPAPAASDPGADYDAAVIAQTNAIRKAHGLAALQVSAKLTAAADQHSASMGKSGYFAHESADGSAFWKRLEQYYPQGNASYWAVGENIIYDSPDLTVPVAMTAWMNSPGHRENILSSDWRELGCASAHLDSAPGVYAGRKTVIITCDFGVRR